ncbi:unnamed protein product [Diamesa serratosioi]
MKMGGSKLLARMLLLISSVTLISLLALTRCGLGGTLDNGIMDDDSQLAAKVPLPKAEDHHMLLMEQRQEENQQQILKLKAEIKNLKLELFQIKNNPQIINQDQVLISSNNISSSSSVPFQLDCTNYIRRQVGNAEILHGLPLNNEYELISFNHFTFNRIYPIDLGLGKRVVEKPIGYKRKDLLDSMNRALESLNRNATTPVGRYTLDDFIEGIYRNEPTTGTQYELFFRTKEKNYKTSHHGDHGTTKIVIMRPFAPLQTIQMETFPKTAEKELIHIILPLAGRVSTFQGFMDKFVKIALKNDRRVQLTVVYFGEEGLSEARHIMSRVINTKSAYSSNLKLLALNETFSRAKGLRVGAQQVWMDDKNNNKIKKDVLLFMCDVDIVFSAKFLDRCRWNTKPNRKVYYPVVFSLYNPHVVYILQGKELPSETDQLIISRDTGFWRDFGYGMTCQYRSDFLKVRGFDEEIVGWGGEDVMLYRKYVRSNIKVVRTTDPGIFHIWHPKVCTGTSNGLKLSADQYRACIRSRALNEASHAQLGFLAFRDDILDSNNFNSSIIFNNNSTSTHSIRSSTKKSTTVETKDNIPHHLRAKIFTSSTTTKKNT